MKLLPISLLVATSILPVAAQAKDEWTGKKSSEWTQEDVAEVLNKSAWTQTTNIFPTVLQTAEQVKANPTGDAKQRIPIYARWFSAGVVREAVARSIELGGSPLPPDQKADLIRPQDRFFMIQVMVAPQMEVQKNEAGRTVTQKVDLKMDSLSAMTFKETADKTSFDIDGTALKLVQLVPPAVNNPTQAMFFFAKPASLPAGAKAANLKLTWNDNKIEFKFDLSKMVWGSTCADGTAGPKVRDLDGDNCPVTDAEKRRRAIQAAVLASGDDALNRAVSDVKLDNYTKEAKHLSAFVFYDANKEPVTPTDPKADVAARKRAMLKALGAWSTENKYEFDFVVFANPTLGKAEDRMAGTDVTKLAKLDGAAAEKFCSEKLVKAGSKVTVEVKPEPAATDKPKTAKKPK